MDVFPIWRRAQVEVDRRALEAPPSPFVLRTTKFLLPAAAAGTNTPSCASACAAAATA